MLEDAGDGNLECVNRAFLPLTYPSWLLELVDGVEAMFRA
jgi:hypothetical protein